MNMYMYNTSDSINKKEKSEIDIFMYIINIYYRRHCVYA